MYFQKLYRRHIIRMCMDLRYDPYACLVQKEWWTGNEEYYFITYHNYLNQLAEPNRMWRGYNRSEAWYNEEMSEALQSAWWSSRNIVNRAIREWEDCHKGKIPAWLKI